MFRRIRHFTAALAVATLVIGSATPASAGLEDIDPNGVPPMFDLIFLRPVGLTMLAVGSVLFVPTAALTGIFSPSDLDKAYSTFIDGPVQFTFRDKLGSH